MSVCLLTAPEFLTCIFNDSRWWVERKKRPTPPSHVGDDSQRPLSVEHSSVHNTVTVVLVL